MENRSLTLYKEQFCLIEVILYAITDARNQHEKEQKDNIKFNLDSEEHRKMI